MKSLKSTLLIVMGMVMGTLFGFTLHEAPYSKSTLQKAQQALGLNFTKPELELMVEEAQENLTDLQALRSMPLNNSVVPAVAFNPLPVGFVPDTAQALIDWPLGSRIRRPRNNAELAFMPVPELASLIKRGKLSSVELTQVYLERLKQYGDTLQCVITLLEEDALAQARRADQELAEGNWRGPLHGIPYGIKDLLAVKGTRTTWGAAPYQTQEIDETATIVTKLNEAGGVLVAKLTLGALAWGDVWYGGTTKNPWNLEQGSSGSSAGSASATAAGLVGFSIGTETWGSIVSPSTRCGTTGLRPTFGRVSRHGAMALSWSMDKIGPITRSAEGAAMVFQAIHGQDPKDPSTIGAAFNYEASVDLSTLKIGYFAAQFEGKGQWRENDRAVLEALRQAGATLEETELPTYEGLEHLGYILSAEAAAAFESLTLSNQDSLMVRQEKNAWPNVFRAAHFVPAVAYIQANRHRFLIQQQWHKYLSQYDVVITPTFGGTQLLMTNLTGQPCVVVPNGFNEKGAPTSITFLGNLFQEAKVLAVAKAYQEATAHHRQHPEWLME